MSKTKKGNQKPKKKRQTLEQLATELAKAYEKERLSQGKPTFQPPPKRTPICDETDPEEVWFSPEEEWEIQKRLWWHS